MDCAYCVVGVHADGRIRRTYRYIVPALYERGLAGEGAMLRSSGQDLIGSEDEKDSQCEETRGDLDADLKGRPSNSEVSSQRHPDLDTFREPRPSLYMLN